MTALTTRHHAALTLALYALAWLVVAFAATALVGFLRAWRTDVELRRHERVRAALRRGQARVVVPRLEVWNLREFDPLADGPYDWEREDA